MNWPKRISTDQRTLNFAGFPWKLAGFLTVILFLNGCTVLPKRMHEPKLYNPFPQIHKVAVIPFFNQSDFPTINGAKVAMSYRHQLQQIRGFEVVPVGVVDQFLKQNPIAINSVPDFQLLAKQLGVDAVVVGSITDFDPYYPPKMGLAVRWYAANECLHPIPPGYGLPWGTSEEEFIPEYLRYEAEFALAQEQLKTQTPRPGMQAPDAAPGAGRQAAIGMPVPGTQQRTHLEQGTSNRLGEATANASYARKAGTGNLGSANLGGANLGSTVRTSGTGVGLSALPASHGQAVGSGTMIGSMGTQPGRWQTPRDGGFPRDWPDSNAFIPDGPSSKRPDCVPQKGPIMSLIKQYDGSNSEFTDALARYYEFKTDKRFGGWESYLQRQDDFISFCCYMHISELLSARGGAGRSKVVWKWPFDPYSEP